MAATSPHRYTAQDVAGLPDLSAFQCRSALRELWKDFTVRPIWNVTARPMPEPEYLYRDFEGTQARSLVLPKSPGVAWESCYSYFGFTHANTRGRYQYKYMSERYPGAIDLEAAIYFTSRQNRLTEIDMIGTGWIYWQPPPPRPDRYPIPPSNGQFVVGLVDKNDKGSYFSRYFIASPEFKNLFFYAMDRDYNYLPGAGDPMRQKIFENLERSYHFGWKDKVSYPEDVRREWMQRPSFMYGDEATSGHANDYYYIYQIFTAGDIVDFHEDRSRLKETKARIKAFFYNVICTSPVYKQNMLDALIDPDTAEEQRWRDASESFYSSGM